jgi:hypothetical protein
MIDFKLFFTLVGMGSFLILVANEFHSPEFVLFFVLQDASETNPSHRVHFICTKVHDQQGTNSILFFLLDTFNF